MIQYSMKRRYFISLSLLSRQYTTGIVLVDLAYLFMRYAMVGIFLQWCWVSWKATATSQGKDLNTKYIMIQYRLQPRYFLSIESPPQFLSSTTHSHPFPLSDH